MSDRERELRLKYEEKCKEVDRLNAELEYSKQQLEDLRKKNCELEIRVDHLEDDLTQLKSSMKKLEDSIKDKEVEKALLEKEKANVETDLWKTKAENERMKRAAAELEAGQARKEVEILRRRLSEHSLGKENEVETVGKQNTDMMEVEKEMWKTTAENDRLKSKEVEREAREEMEKPLFSQKPVQHAALSETSQNPPPHDGRPPSHISNHARPPGHIRRHSAASAADNSHRKQLRTSVCTPPLTLPSLPSSKSADSLQSTKVSEANFIGVDYLGQVVTLKDLHLIKYKLPGSKEVKTLRANSRLSHDWEKLAIFLDIEHNECVTIKQAQMNDPDKCLNEVINYWLTRKSLKCTTWRHFLRILRNANCKAHAEEIERALQHRHISDN